MSSSSPSDNLAVAAVTTTTKTNTERVKFVLCVRSDLRMSCGKIAAQCSHTTLGLFLTGDVSPELHQRWVECGETTVVLRVTSGEELRLLSVQANHAGFKTFMFYDEGRTQIAPNSPTVLAIGPASAPQLDLIVGHLKLLA